MLFNFFKTKPINRPPLRLRNTLSGELESFSPLNGAVKVYNCGPTAYDQQHIGNLFPPIVANILHRTLVAWGYSVKEVNNITDFGHISEDEDTEDKMTKGLRREGLPPTLKNMRIVAEKYAALFFDDLPKVGVNPKRVLYPRASDYIDEQVALVKTLEQKGYAYRTSDGVYFDTSKFSGYGKLGGLSTGEQRARIEENKEKKSTNDFALWKKDAKLGWKSPWGLGFPGWHTECVAMIFKLLGRQIDIHMGGIDLVSIHHNNEIAQAEAATGKPFVKYWLHNAHITVEGKKVSKSLGNTIYLHNIIDRGLSPRALRYWFLTGHYRTPMNFTWEAIEGADTALGRLGRAYLQLPKGTIDKNFMQSFYAAVAEDLNTAKALALVWEHIQTLNQATLAEADKVLGLGLAEAKPTQKLTVTNDDLPEGIKALVEAREAARKHKDFEKADEMRKEIESAGYELVDTPTGPVVSKK
jgi:cysteinyl-tRNA synthetase